ncbi:MAG: hypothetical protein HQK83_14390 [Fibrobacteria bacterium]|nr:hypothetical protein [Fibrobacteria bacterium]
MIQVFFFLFVIVSALPVWSAEDVFIRQIGPNKNNCGITLPLKKTDKEAGLIVWFHGGMRSNLRNKGGRAHLAILPFTDSSCYVVSPSAFKGQDWLTSEGVENIRSLVNYMLKRYRVNKQDINLVGVSDGCLAVIHYSMVAEHPINRRLLFSSFPGLVLQEGDLPAQKNFFQGSWYFFQGAKDRLFPSARVFPYLYFWKKTFPHTTLYLFPNGLHDFSFYATNASDKIKQILIK